MEKKILLKKSRNSSNNQINIYNNSDSNNESSDEEVYEKNYTANDNYRLICRSKFFKRLTVCGFIIVFCVLFYIPLSNNDLPRIAPISGWHYNTSRNTSEYVQPNLNTTSIDPVNICNGKKLLLLVVVCSSPSNFEQRQGIRETWGNVSEFNYHKFKKIHDGLKGKYLEINDKNWKDYVISSEIVDNKTISDNSVYGKLDNSSHNKLFSIKIVFLIGQTESNETQMKLIEENDNFGDIIQENFIDSYNNLTIKSVMMLKWVVTNCNDKVKFVMKCDDDIFLNVPNLIHILLGGTVPLYNSSIGLYDQKSVHVLSSENRLKIYKRFLIGFLFCHAKPIADTTSKWYSPIYMYSGDIYPNYVSGTGYVMTMDTLKMIYNVSLVTPLFHLEDVYITGICTKKIKLHPHHNPLFFHDRISNDCLAKTLITHHHTTPSILRKFYNLILNPNINCTSPTSTFNYLKIKPRQRYCT